MRTLIVSSGWQHSYRAVLISGAFHIEPGDDASASIAPAIPPTVIWVPKPTSFLSLDTLDMIAKVGDGLGAEMFLYP
jgi:hypothetical protein